MSLNSAVLRPISSIDKTKLSLIFIFMAGTSACFIYICLIHVLNYDNIGAAGAAAA